MESRRNIWIGAGLIVALAIIGFFYLTAQPDQAKDEAEVKALVVEFGAYLKSISLQEPSDTLKGDIQQVYGPYVTDALLQSWRADPTHAPGRQTSSPWPDRIEVSSIAPQGQGYVASGDIVMMTSSGEAGRVPVVLQVIQQNGDWRIAVYQEGQSTSKSVR